MEHNVTLKAIHELQGQSFPCRKKYRQVIADAFPEIQFDPKWIKGVKATSCLNVVHI
jgi:hypothetical protein